MLHRRAFVAASLGLLAWPAGRLLGQTPNSKAKSARKSAPVSPPPPGPIKATEALNRLLAPVRDKHRVPGMAAAILVGERVAAIGATGIRKIGAEEPIGIEDTFHLGSCTKAMTATLLGMLVDDGLLKWNATIAEVFSDRAANLHEDFRSVTLMQLLNHRAGLPHDGPWWRLGYGLSTTDQRRALVDRMLAQAPTSQPGTAYAYSNVGYVVAGAMAEKVTGKSWEDLMRERLFEKLGMATAGFGLPAHADRVDQPWGHRERDGEVRPVLEDNAPVVGPASTAHANLPDWGKFAALHLRAEQGAARLLKPETFRALHTPPKGEEYAGGWYVADRSWAAGRTLMHKGSNLSWFATIWLAPQRNGIYLVATNQGGDAAEAACEEATEALIRYHAFSLPASTPKGARRRRR